MTKCPCCGYNTLKTRDNYEICFLCSWEDDGQDDEDANRVRGGPNGDYSLTEARENFKQYFTMYRPSDPSFIHTQNPSIIEIKKKIMDMFDAINILDDWEEKKRLSQIIENNVKRLDKIMNEYLLTFTQNENKGRFVQTAPDKGSRKWIQILINIYPELLNSEIKKNLDLLENEEITWLSPLKKDEYAEYRDQGFLDLLGIKLGNVPLEDFWPKMGPQWDALGKSSSGKIFLVEAKSNINEIISTLKATNENSVMKIKKSLEKTKSYLKAEAEIDWTKRIYQYGNRLAHLYLLRKLNDINAYLIFVYFINDNEMNGPKTPNEWRGAVSMLNAYLGIDWIGKHRLLRYSIDIFIDVKRLTK